MAIFYTLLMLIASSIVRDQAKTDEVVQDAASTTASLGDMKVGKTFSDSDAQEIKNQDLKDLFASHDTNTDGVLSLVEFVSYAREVDERFVLNEQGCSGSRKCCSKSGGGACCKTSNCDDGSAKDGDCKDNNC
jgi:hypothetical protein